ncbi:antibiotic biosynthesis monooxygenase [Streptomyces zhihengii]|uniref:Antibiotic biosynthesis monooxygenase n=1 Tax=Streptomyces zhihengii TaxID=1818004 RepID=A0ABS2UP33_9ACTN|nr:antibiotic biosynthesis monooxygenase [Streptomyces zhihengii]MBM9618480.1 antibiotic biosynthesis monooxygenase [Streptomyces zhihengii]
MTVVRITRFRTDPANDAEMIDKRATLIAAVRESYPGLTEARLGRLEDGTWVDHWYWESTEHMQKALAAAPTIPEAGAAFALTTDTTAESAEIVAVV